MSRTKYKIIPLVKQMNLKKYLKQVQSGESIFPMDSPHKKKKPLRVVYPEQAAERKRVMVDFDGVISNYKHGWNNGKLVDEPNPGTKEALDELHSRGFEVVIFTTRASEKYNTEPPSSKLVAGLKLWLAKYNIYYDYITAEKLGAIAYIDDRALTFKNNWTEILSEITKMEKEI